MGPIDGTERERYSVLSRLTVSMHASEWGRRRETGLGVTVFE